MLLLPFPAAAAFDSQRQTHCKRRKSAQVLNQTVVSTTAANSCLSTELIACDLKGCISVVIEPTHKLRIGMKRNCQHI